MVTRRDYSAEAVEAARSVMIELTHLLGEYREDIVVVGGWVPELLPGMKIMPHIGSTDVDLALDHRNLREEGYQTIRKLLLSRGYTEGTQPFIFWRTVVIHKQPYEVEVDFLAGQYEGTGRKHRTQRIQDMFARKARGCDLAFIAPVSVKVAGTLPDGTRDSVEVRVASIVPFLVMKGMATADRIKEKDAWDIYFCIRNYPGAPDSIVDAFRPHLENALVREGLQKIAQHFASLEHMGPRHVVEFEEITDEEEKERVRRDAYERVNDLLERLGIR